MEEELDGESQIQGTNINVQTAAQMTSVPNESRNVHRRGGLLGVLMVMEVMGTTMNISWKMIVHESERAFEKDQRAKQKQERIQRR